MWLYWHKPMKRNILECLSTPRALLNFFVLQWFGFRLGEGHWVRNRHTYNYALIIGVVPLTGWWGPYRGLRKWIPMV